MQAEIEGLMARLLTDRALRERFAADPYAVARAHGLSAQESDEIAALPMQDLVTAASSYEHKRGTRRRRGWRQHLLRWLRR
jgi:hypothetical protein